ncbi:hypothetical protein COV06_01905 [Candidatus Uhrbacteria bacterium CG10_big_fil_rev_8_21_14_0_10_50_16]|uniref:Uncharacterized protein n=1 Tax=Candidatus Uhrbacteria bacterium CG10_big_fil_rev_8_21_14_0_10_50_16 TaxID=1975039 RepID=A0A2H0RMQ8_9BACT|nr:MAG: hypothetical protein COV06_01905 [Candidatus Uhrbacteria bacterium CG10_big_fil_rev_8_21_14_0_10_50_16]
MKHLLTLLSFSLLLLPSPGHAESLYSHVAVSSGVNAPSSITGAPDGASTTFTSSTSWVEPGFPQTSTGDVSFQYTAPSDDLYSMTVNFMNGASIEHSAIVIFVGTAPTGIETIQNPDGVTFDRIHISPDDPLFGIDAVWIETAGSDPVVDPISEPVTPVDSTTDDALTGQPAPEPLDRPIGYPRLVKLTDDHNASTQYDTAVYAIDSQGKRRPFSNETIYFSWFPGFDDVEEISASEMASIPLGAAMPMHQGTWLVKIQSTPDVYAVEQGGVLRRIPDETTALYYYGPDWAKRVRDIAPTDWPRYTKGEDLSYVHPDDSIVRDQNLVVWHIRNGVKRQISENDLAFYGIDDDVIVYSLFSVFNPSLVDLVDSYPIGMMYDRSDDFNWYSF